MLKEKKNMMALKLIIKQSSLIKGSKDCPMNNDSIMAQGNLKVFLAVAANKGFDVVNFYIGNGYIQRGHLKGAWEPGRVCPISRYCDKNTMFEQRDQT